MSEDLIKGMLAKVAEIEEESVALGGAGGPAAAAATSTALVVHEPVPRSDTETLPHMFCNQLFSLLQMLHGTFPENAVLGKWIAHFETKVLGHTAMEEWVVKTWHYDMTVDPTTKTLYAVDLYTLTRKRNIEALFASELWVLKEINARELYFHEEIDDEEREALCKHFDRINSYSKVFSAIPDGMREAIERVTAEIDPTQEITGDTMTHLLQNMLNGPHANMEQLMSWASHLMTSFSDGEGLEAMQTLMSNPMVAQATGGMNLGSLMSSLQSELVGGIDGHSSITPDADMMKKCLSIFGMSV
jgi:hypothetical protein